MTVRLIGEVHSNLVKSHQAGRSLKALQHVLTLLTRGEEDLDIGITGQ
jgi:hypothetical protein